MVLESLKQADWIVLFSIIFCAAIGFSYFLQEILGEMGAGFLLGTVLLTAGAFGGIFLLDFLFLYSFVPRRFAVIQGWIVGATAGGSALFFTGIVLRQLVKK